MRLLLILIILLAFPVIDLYVLAKLVTVYGWWMALYLLVVAVFGVALIKEERFAVFARLFSTVQHGQHPMMALAASARTLVAGLLFIFPGVLSDIVAVLLMLVPIPKAGTRQPAANDDVIEGQWRRED